MMRVAMAVVALVITAFSSIGAKELPSLYRSARVLGMGGAFVAVSNDENALLFNPAGLADIKTSRFTFPLPQVAFNAKALGMYMDAADTDFDSVDETADFLRKNMGDTGYISGGFFPAYVRPNFGFGIVVNGSASTTPKNPLYPRLNIESVQDAAACVGIAYPLLGGEFLMGVGAKYVFRKSLDREYTVPEITSGDFKETLKDDFDEGSGVLVDTGLIYKIGSYKVAGTPGTVQVGISANNLVGDDLGDAADLDPHVDLGFSTRIGEDLLLALDYVDITGDMGDDDNAGKRIHMGVEYQVKPGVALRAGLNQGYPTVGIGLAAKRVVFDIATYAEEKGLYAGQKDDRRYVFRLGLTF